MRTSQLLAGRVITLSLLFFLLVLFALGCARSPVESVESSDDSIILEHSASEYADELIEMAIEAEPWISPVLVYLAELQKGEMIGLEFRLKSRDSLIKKIESRTIERDYRQARDVPIRDTLRFTMQFGDQPKGHHNQSVAHVISTMENLGHTVIVVKNYWPPGDDYSGINTILEAPNGLAWELQFHTPESFDLKMSSHKAYEQVRQTGTSIEKRRSLFFQVTAQWGEVSIPAGILEPGSLHPLEEVILRPSPSNQ